MHCTVQYYAAQRWPSDSARVCTHEPIYAAARLMAEAQLVSGVRLHTAAARIQSNFRGRKSRNNHLRHLLDEILATERAYVQDLTKAIEHYFKPLRELSLGPAKHRLVEPDVVAAIFGNLEDVLVIAEELLARIAEEIEAGGTQLGQIFITHSFALKLYARYVFGFEEAADRLHEAEKSEAFVAWLRERRLALDTRAAAAPKGLGSRSSGLRDLLIKPVQRIPRYELLLKELVKIKTKLNEDDPLLHAAVSSLMEVGRHNNDVIFHAQNRERLYALQKKLGTARIVEDGRVLLRDGPVMKVCRKDHKPYRLVLLSDQLLTVTEITGGKYKLHHRIMLEDPATAFSIQPVARLGDTALRIESSLKSFICYCDTVPETREWTDELQHAVDACRGNVSGVGLGQYEATTLTGGSSLATSIAKPVWVQDAEITACMLCRNNFSVRMRRHHCRICGSLVCGACSPHRVVLDGHSADPRAIANAERVCKSCKRHEVEHGSFAAAFEAARMGPNAPSTLLITDQAPLFAGYLEKKGAGAGAMGRRNWKRRWFVLQRDLKLAYFESTQHSDSLGELDLQIQTLVVGPGRLQFTLRSEARDFHMRTESGDTKHYNQWLEHLKRAVAAAKGEDQIEDAVRDSDDVDSVDGLSHLSVSAAALQLRRRQFSADQHRKQQLVHRWCFREESSVGIVLVELEGSSGAKLVAVESVVVGGQAHQQSSCPGRKIGPGLVLVEVNAKDVYGWPYVDVVPLLSSRPLALGFCEDAECGRMVGMVSLLVTPADADADGAAAVSEGLPPMPRPSMAMSDAAGDDSDDDDGDDVSQSLWESSLHGHAVRKAPSGDDAPVVLVLLADRLRSLGLLGAVEIFAREADATSLSEMRYCLRTATTQEELQSQIDAGGNATLTAAASDPYVLSALYLGFLSEWPGGVLLDIDAEDLMSCETEDDALELLGAMAEPEQDLMNCVIALMTEVADEEESNRMGHAELSVELAATLASCSRGPSAARESALFADQDLHVELEAEAVEVFAYMLIDFWAEHIRD